MVYKAGTDSKVKLTGLLLAKSAVNCACVTGQGGDVIIHFGVKLLEVSHSGFITSCDFHDGFLQSLFLTSSAPTTSILFPTVGNQLFFKNTQTGITLIHMLIYTIKALHNVGKPGIPNSSLFSLILMP